MNFPLNLIHKIPHDLHRDGKKKFSIIISYAHSISHKLMHNIMHFLRLFISLLTDKCANIIILGGPCEENLGPFNNTAIPQHKMALTVGGTLTAGGGNN